MPNILVINLRGEWFECGSKGNDLDTEAFANDAPMESVGCGIRHGLMAVNEDANCGQSIG